MNHSPRPRSPEKCVIAVLGGVQRRSQPLRFNGFAIVEHGSPRPDAGLAADCLRTGQTNYNSRT